jgi:tetratricopeptide (TPR) repeat protein
MQSDCFFEARTCYEDGLQLIVGDDSKHDLKVTLSGRIEGANIKLAERNLFEAECAQSRGDTVKAIDHLELVKTLTSDPVLREKAELLIQKFSPSSDEEHVQVPSSSCGSCASSSCGEPSENEHVDDTLPIAEYYQLLIHQLPADQFHRYAELDDVFAAAYVAASRDDHVTALHGFEHCVDTLPHDIYLYEKGKILHRLGNDKEAEQCLRQTVQLNHAHSLAWITLAYLLRENNRFNDCLEVVEVMIAEQILPEQALLLRADICEVTGDHEGAVALYVELLQTPFVRTAAEKLYLVLMEIGRESDAAVIFKKYLNKSCH